MDHTKSNNFIQFQENAVTLTHPDILPGGAVAAIPSKSHAHRLLIAAALSHTPVRLICPTTSRDIDATVDCLRAMGAEIIRTEDGFLCRGIHAETGASDLQVPGANDAAKGPSSPSGSTAYEPTLSDTHNLDVGESGSTLRFLLPVLGALGMNAAIHMQGRLSQRPLSPLYEEMCRHGVTLSPAGSNPLLCHGQMSSGTYEINGGVSSQYITGLLFALPLLPENSRLVITGKLESRPYVDITLKVLREFGITIHSTELTRGNAASLFDIPGGQAYHPVSSNIRETEHFTCPVEGDWSNAAFFLTAGALLENPVTVTGCDLNSPQGDKAIVSLLQEFGAEIEIISSEESGGSDDSGKYDDSGKSDNHDKSDDFRESNDFDRSDNPAMPYKSAITIRGGHLKGISIDAENIPDLVPILSVAAAFAEGITKIRHIERLRIKESDRVATVLEMLSRLGADADLVHDPSGDLIRISGRASLPGGRVSSHNDHRIAMAAAIASLRCSGPVTIEDPMAVRKSYPGFYEDLGRLLS